MIWIPLTMAAVAASASASGSSSSTSTTASRHSQQQQVPQVPQAVAPLPPLDQPKTATTASSASSSSLFSQLPQGGGDHWVSLTNDIEFLSATLDKDTADNTKNGQQSPALSSFVRQLQHQQQQRLAKLQHHRELNALFTDPLVSQYTTNVFADSTQEWDDYQQAWRYLGFFIDCSDDSKYTGEYYYYNRDQHNSGGDGATTDEGCERFVLWAAYVDEDYEGGGAGEYQYYDRINQKWDDTACKVTGNERCAKMDCHEENTSFTLLGLFKHREPDDWMEQLFKHEGYCIWTDEEYDFMKGARKAWPQGCTYAQAKDMLGGQLYYDIKPKSNGRIGVGIYTDTKCVQEYHGPLSVNQVVGGDFFEQGSGSGGDYEQYYGALTYSEAQELWDSAFNIFAICQPCIAYDLQNYYSDQYGQGQNYYYNNGGDDFSCDDQAGYTSVNQCMKFMAKTAMDTATTRDVVLAHRQGSLVEDAAMPMAGMEKGYRAYPGQMVVTIAFAVIYFVASLSCMVYAVIKFRRARNDTNFAPNWSLKEPLQFD